MFNSKFDPTAVRYMMATLGVAASATAYGAIGISIMQSPNPQVAACMAGNGLSSFGGALIWGGVGLLILWIHAETKHLNWEWHGWREKGRPVASMHLIRQLLTLGAIASIVGCFITFTGSMVAGYSAATQVAAGACPLPAASSETP